nr:hypothetical protein [uncultured Psychroserpens sp.]
MRKLQSQFSIKQVIITPIVLILVVIFLCSILTFTALEMTKDGTSLHKTLIWVVLPFILLLIWTIRYYLKTFKRYTFLNKGFEVVNVFGKEFHSWKTVKQISVIENSYEKILGQYLKEDLLSIQLRDGKLLNMYSKYYKNMPEIRRYFNAMSELEIINAYTNSSNTVHQPFKKKTYKGSFICSFNGIMALFLIALCGLMLLTKWSSMTLIGFIFLLGLPIFILSVFGFQSYYFQLNQKFLVIRNQLFIHLKHQIDLEKVNVIYFEQKFKKESSIRIINDDYSMVSFQSSTLKNKQWKSLIITLKERGIQVVDELFYEYNE